MAGREMCVGVKERKCVQQGDIEGFRDFSHFTFCILHFMWIQPLYYIYYYNNIYNIKYL